MSKKILAILLAVCMVMSLAPAAFAADTVFGDVAADAWYADEVKWAYEEGLMNGTGDGAFSPALTTTRGMIVTILWRMEGEPEVEGEQFADVAADAYYAKAIQWAAANKIVEGYGAGLFGPGDEITREQLATIMYRYAQYKEIDVSEKADLSAYADADVVHAWAKDAMEWAVAAGLISGVTEDSLAPTGAATRAQVAVILYRLDDEVISGGEEEPEEPEEPEKPSTPSIPVHFHSYTASYTSNNDGTHAAACVCGASKTEDCEYGDDTICDKCTFDKGAEAVIGTTYYATLAEAVAAVTDATPVEIIVLKTEETATVANIEIPGGSNITLRGVSGTAADVKVSGQIATTSSIEGSLTIKDITILVDDTIVDATGISQTSKSAIALWGNQTVNCENVVFNMSLADSSAISGWWDTGIGTTINVKNCVFNCNGQRPIRTCGNVTVEGSTFNDPYRYAIQLTGKAGTATELEDAVINFKNNTIVNGENGKSFVYGIQLEGETYGCNDLIINGSGNTIVDGGEESTMYYCECGKVEHATVAWNTEVPAVHASNFVPVAKIDGGEYASLADAIATVTDATPVEIVVLKTEETATVANIEIPGGSNITLRGETGTAADVKISGQIATTSSTEGSLTIKDITILVDNTIVDSTGISQTSKSSIALWGNQTVNCENVVFNMSLAESSAISGWWDTGIGTTINVKNCVFNCNGQRPIRTCGNVTVEGSTFNDPYRYAIQLTGKAGTATELEKAVINFKNNTIVNGENGKAYVYGIQLEGETYGCNDLIINGSGNTIVDGGEESTMYYCECGKVEHATVAWNTEVAAKHTDEEVYPGILKTGAKTYDIVSKEGLLNLQTLLTSLSPNEANIITVNLCCDVDLTGEDWAPIVSMWVTFNGNGHTISNLTAGFDSTGRRSGFWSYAGAVTINDLTLENVNVTGSQAGIFAGSAEGFKANNCVVKGTNTVTFKAGDETWNGIGAITGVLTDSTVNVTIAEGATVTVNKGAMTTDPGCTYIDELTGYISANNGDVVNKGTVTVNATAATADVLAGALKAGENVTLTDGVETEAATTAPYGNKVGFVQNGGVLDGNGNKLDIECYGDDYGIMTSGGTVKNLTIENGCRAIMIMYPTQDIILDKVKLGGDGVLYPINTGEAGAAGVKLIVTNSTIKGWTSYGNIESASFTNCEFGQGTYYNNIYGRVLKPYVNTTLTDCSFIEHMNLDLSSLANGQKVTIKNCTVNSQAVTADVFTVPSSDAEYDTELFTVDLPSWASSIADCIVFVD